MQGGRERMSEESNVGGLLSSGSGEVCIYSISMGLRLAGEKQCEWVASAFVPRGKPKERQRKDNCGKNGAQSKVQHNDQQLFISTHAL